MVNHSLRVTVIFFAPNAGSFRRAVTDAIAT